MWPNPQESADLVTFTEEILNGKLHFLCSENYLPRFVFSDLDADYAPYHTIQKKRYVASEMTTF